jgi:hypothetical protein
LELKYQGIIHCRGPHVICSGGTPNTLEKTITGSTHINNEGLGAVRARVVKCLGISNESKRLKLGFFWLVIIGTYLKSSPILAQNVKGILLPTVVADC